MEILEFIYDNSREDIKIYNMVNLASVLEQIRNGCILGGVYNENIKEFYYMLHKNNLHGMKYPSSKSDDYINIIILRKLDKDLEKLYFKLHDTFKKDKNQFAVNTGKILGYIHPSTLKNNNISYKAYIEVTVANLYNGLSNTIHFFPQKVKNISEKTYNTLDDMRKQVLRLKLPKGFIIDYASVYLGD